MGKKGLSTVVTTLLIILLSIVAIGMVWVVVNNIISQGTEGISLSKASLSLEITSLKIRDFSIDVKVKRNLGKGDLIGVRFSLKDNGNSEIIEKSTTMQELEERTFTIRQAECNLVNLRNLTEISIAPIVGVEAGKQTIGDLVAFYTVSGAEFIGGSSGGESECNYSEDCGINGWSGSSFCGVGGNVWRNSTVYTCEIEICTEDTTSIETELCDGEGCNSGECVNESLGCITDSSCGLDDFIDTPICLGNESWQNYTTYTCNDGACLKVNSFDLKNNCSENQPPEMCGVEGRCVIWAECSEHIHCDGACGSPTTPCMCNSDSECEIEYMANDGIVNAAWPPEINEFFDSSDLTSISDVYQDYYVGFPGSIETRCVQIKEYLSFLGINPYIRFYVESTNISVGNNYEIWETFYNCNKSVS